VLVLENDMDPEIELLIPERDTEQPQVSIVVPALNEEVNIGEFVSWCHEGLQSAGVTGEILIVDSSDDATPQIALNSGARVLRCPKRGLGRAYIDALPFVRGEWIIMGDADCTYDFRQIAPFIDGFRNGGEFVMGSRWMGSIEKGAMPPHHQYFGTPITTWILNRLYSSKFTDIHCGMRGITKSSLHKMQLQSQSWEYASEMVLKSVHMQLRTVEVPVHFLKDRNGRVSHHRREGWWSPFAAAWINLRAMFVYGADFFTFLPGIVLTLLGLLLTIPSTFGSIEIASIRFSIFWQMLGMTFVSLGLVGIYSGVVSRILFDYTGSFSTKWLRRLRYTRTAIFSGIIFVIGICFSIPLVNEYISNDLVLPEINNSSVHLAITGLTAILGSSITFVFVLLIHASHLASRFQSSLDEN
jgi:glycosyltransferase involved in cell wall biosynthesis